MGRQSWPCPFVIRAIKSNKMFSKRYKLSCLFQNGNISSATLECHFSGGISPQGIYCEILE